MTTTLPRPVLDSPPRRSRDGLINAMTIDVEEYFQVSAFEGTVPRSAWSTYESRVRRSMDSVLGILDDAGVRCTFFVLGWIAERAPDLLQRISAAGHEIASHGYEHRLVYSMTPAQFRDDLRRARFALESSAGVPVLGYRAPSYSITRASLWALDVLIDEGYAYDASVYPIHHDRYGIPDWPRAIHRVERPGGSIWELPGSTIRIAGVNLPIGGGGYFRLLPYGWTRRGIELLNRREQRPAVFYLHPWELDPGQPRVAVGGLSRVRHYTNLGKTEPRLRRLLREFPFGTVSEVLARTEGWQGTMAQTSVA